MVSPAQKKIASVTNGIKYGVARRWDFVDIKKVSLRWNILITIDIKKFVRKYR